MGLRLTPHITYSSVSMSSVITQDNDIHCQGTLRARGEDRQSMMRSGATTCLENKMGMSEHVMKGYFFTIIRL